MSSEDKQEEHPYEIWVWKWNSPGTKGHGSQVWTSSPPKPIVHSVYEFVGGWKFWRRKEVEITQEVVRYVRGDLASWLMDEYDRMKTENEELKQKLSLKE